VAFSFVQNGPNAAGTGGTITASLNAPSTQGTLLLAGVSSTAGTNAFASPGTGWQLAVAISAGAGLRAEVWYYPSNPGNITSAVWTNGATGVPKAQLSEFSSAPGTTQALDSVATGASGTTTGPYTTNNATPKFGNDLAFGQFVLAFSAAPTGQTWTTPAGWTRDGVVNTTSQPWSTYYEFGPAQNTAFGVTGSYSSALNETFWAANLVTFTQMPGELLAIIDSLSVGRPAPAPQPRRHAAHKRPRRPTIRPASVPPPAPHPTTEGDKLAITDSLSVAASVSIGFTPATSPTTVSGDEALEYVTGPQYLPPAPVFLKTQMPRMYLQNILTGQWIHRDVPNITQPQTAWNLNAAGTFSCVINPPHPSMLDSTGNPLPQLWQTACYLEQAGSINWGGILTQMQPQGPQLSLTFTEFTGYPNGMPYEGPNISQANYDALDAVRGIWAWLQSYPNGNLGLVLDNTKNGVLLGAASPFAATSVLTSDANPGDTRVDIVTPTKTPGQLTQSAFTVGQKVQVGTENATHKITYAGIDHLLLADAITSHQPADSIVGQVQPTTPYTLDWWNNTDCGQEISQIQAEAPFDFRETHTWADAAKSSVRHRLAFGVPRLGTRRTDLRFAEGENIIEPGQGNQDGTVFGNDVIVIGAGTGSASVRGETSVIDGRLRRTMIYTDMTINRPDRAANKAARVLAAAEAVDTVTSITVSNHPNAPFGTFFIGDDIPVQLATGWRHNVTIWSRIIGIQQNPQVPQMVLTLARSDSFTYMAQTGAGGNI
jgi:hypothetical protein